GSFELTAGSDIDLILLYDYYDAASESDGPKPLDATRYFTLITQSLMAALSAPTAEGVLYEVDMRLAEDMMLTISDSSAGLLPSSENSWMTEGR
ncbi:hypothetical protein ACC754_38185, partial [Rhizobium johnstonii]